MKPVVILDTNVLFDDPYFTGPQTGKLLALSKRSRVELVVPEVVLQELQSQQRRIVSQRLDHLKRVGSKVQDSLSALRLPKGDYPVSLPRFDHLEVDVVLGDSFAQLRESLSNNRVTVLPLPEVTHEELLRRDLRGRPPFDNSGKGYRDALIWHSVLARWRNTLPLDDDGFFVTADGDFGQDGLHPSLAAEVAGQAALHRVGSLEELLTHPSVSTLHATLQNELEVAAVESERASRAAQGAMHAAARQEVVSAVDSMYGVPLSEADVRRLRLPREMDDVEISGTSDVGDFEWAPYDQLDSDTMLGLGSASAEVELTAWVDKEDAAVLADRDVNVLSWDHDMAEVLVTRQARITFDLTVNVSGTVIDGPTFTSIEAE